jgi:predicted RecB family nuclease
MAGQGKYFISKSNMALGIRCPKALHLAIHRKDLRTKPDQATQARFDQGNEIGARAREHFDQDGVVIHAKPWEYGPSLQATKAAMASDAVTIYEGAFSDGILYSRADILHRKNGEWHLIEVKDGMTVKDEHINDVAIQALTMRRAGFAPASYSIMFINRECVFPDLSNLFQIQEVTVEVNEALPAIEAKVDELIASTAGKEPAMKLGKHCVRPYECSFKDHCWSALPDFNVFELPRMDADVAGGLVAQGLLEIKQLKPEMFPEEEKVQRAIRATVSGERFIDRAVLQAAVSGWKYPLYFLDFETVMPAIPRYPGTRPYTQVTYQFSCHILRTPDSELEHREYLHLDTSDPREKLVAELCAAIGDEGSVVSYYAKFEGDRMKELAEAFPQFAPKLLSIVERLVDPLPLMREHVYDPNFRGSFSIKSVAPTLLGEEFRYDNKAVSDGLMASIWADRCLRGLMSGAAVNELRPKLLDYCRQDTMAMVKLWDWSLGR